MNIDKLRRRHYFRKPVSNAQWLSVYGVVVCLFALMPLPIHAQMFQSIALMNPKAMSLGNAVTADPPGIDSIHFNPAGIALLKGRYSEAKFFAANFKIQGDVKNSDVYQSQLDALNWEDPVANHATAVEGVSAMIPGFGMKDIPLLVAGNAGWSYHLPGTKITLATGVYTPMAAGFTRADDDVGRFVGRQMALTRLTYFAPTIAVKLTPKLVAGFSLGFNYMGMGIDTDFRAPNAVLATAEQVFRLGCGEDGTFPILDVCQGSFNPLNNLFRLQVEVEEPLSLSYNVGALWNPVDWLSLGAVYQSGARDTLKGDLDLTWSPQITDFLDGLIVSSYDNPIEPILIALGLPEDSAPIKRDTEVKLSTPKHLAFGLSIDITPRLMVNVDYKWTETSSWDELRIKTAEISFLRTMSILAEPGLIDGENITFPLNHENSKNWAIGLTYRYSDRWVYRAGYEPRDSAIPKDRAGLMFPMGKADFFGMGISYRKKPDRFIDLALTHIRSDQFIPANTSKGGNSLYLQNVLYNPYAGMNVTTQMRAWLVSVSLQKSI